MKVSSWGFLSILDSFDCQQAHGIEFQFNVQTKKVTDLLSKGMRNAEYWCTFEPNYEYKEHWIPLITNKYGNCVAGLLFRKDPPVRLLLLPQMPQFDQIILPLIEELCLKWNSALFPFHEGQLWVHRPEYEVPKIIELQKQIDEVRNSADIRIEQIEAEIEQIKNDQSDWYTLLNGTGDELVATVIRTLKQLGFNEIKDMDAEAKENGTGTCLREDIQIHDQLPILIVDVKGVQGHPEDAEATQSEKHALMRAKEFNGDVKPLTIINHQRNIPPHDRDSVAYRKAIINNAEHTKLGLMTTWDLFCLLRNKEKLGWPAESVLPIFYRSGRIDPIPEHYHSIGKVFHVWKHAFGIIPEADIPVGAILAVESEYSFEEIVVKSLRVDDQQTDVAVVNSKCGVFCSNASERLRKNSRVFMVTKALSLDDGKNK